MNTCYWCDKECLSTIIMCSEDCLCGSKNIFCSRYCASLIGLFEVATDYGNKIFCRESLRPEQFIMHKGREVYFRNPRKYITTISDDLPRLDMLTENECCCVCRSLVCGYRMIECNSCGKLAHRECLTRVYMDRIISKNTFSHKTKSIVICNNEQCISFAKDLDRATSPENAFRVWKMCVTKYTCPQQLETIRMRFKSYI